MGHSGKGSTGYMIPAIAKPLLGLKVKVIGGYEGSRDTILAMEKGEIDGTVQAWQAWTAGAAGVVQRRQQLRRTAAAGRRDA